ncbi:uncharacterized protein [Anabrus simplex]|uniref:uncharacterized protein n=1 Tax=Anabrus simplex TaxID=316456 RepID=UPI0034DD76F1
MIVPSIFHLLAAAWLFASQGWFISGSRQDQVDVDLDLGVVTGYSERVQFLTSPSPKTHKAKCSRQAVIKVELGGALQVAQLVLKYSNPKLWTLHISDSSLAEGYGSLQNSSATTEIEVINQQLRIYSEWPPPNTVVSMRDSDGTGTTHSQWMFLRVVDETVRKHTQMELTMNLRSNSFRWQDGRLTQDFPAPPGLFYQHDAQKNKVTIWVWIVSSNT